MPATFLEVINAHLTECLQLRSSTFEVGYQCSLFNTINYLESYIHLELYIKSKSIFIDADLTSILYPII